MILSIIETIYKPVPNCHQVECACGEIYTKHEVKSIPACKIHNEVLIDVGYRVKVDRGDSIVMHSINQCPVCKGLDLRYWRNSDYILEKFNSGCKTVTVYNL